MTFRPLFLGRWSASGDWDTPEDRLIIKAGFLRFRTWRGTFPPRPKYVEMGLQLRVDARPIAAGQLPLSRIYCPPNLVSGDPLWPRPPITCKSTAARIPYGRG